MKIMIQTGNAYALTSLKTAELAPYVIHSNKCTKHSSE